MTGLSKLIRVHRTNPFSFTVPPPPSPAPLELCILYLYSFVHLISKHQTITSQNTTEIEMHAIYESIKDINCTKRLVANLNLLDFLIPDPTILNSDNNVRALWSIRIHDLGHHFIWIHCQWPHFYFIHLLCYCRILNVVTKEDCLSQVILFLSNLYMKKLSMTLVTLWSSCDL